MQTAAAAPRRGPPLPALGNADPVSKIIIRQPAGYDVEVLRHVAVRLNPPFLEGEDYEMRWVGGWEGGEGGVGVRRAELCRAVWSIRTGWGDGHFLLLCDQPCGACRCSCA